MAGEPNAGFDPSDWECHQELVGYDYSAMRGPCPEGFHVPLGTEIDGFISMLAGLSITTMNQAITNLHLPPMGCRESGNAAIDFRDRCYYWTASPYGSRYPDCAKIFVANSNGINTNGVPPRARALPIRPFKDVPVIPTSSRTTIYEGDAWGDGTNWYTPGIFWDQANGLISISSNGKTTDSSVWVTITDKNLGATVVYNYGDTMTEANMGKMYQRGNNYGFPSTGSVTTSSTKVDASNYGPNNYFSSSTFITTSNNEDWSSIHNDNLWGGQDGAIPIYEEVCPEFKYHGALQTFHFQPTLLDISDLKEFPEEEGLFFNTPNVYGIAEELNKYPQVYYAKFLGENNLYSAYGKTNVLGNGEGDPYIVTETFKGEPYKYITFYNTETMKREVYSEYGGLSIDV